MAEDKDPLYEARHAHYVEQEREQEVANEAAWERLHPQPPPVWVAVEAARLRAEQRSAEPVKAAAKKDESLGR